MDETAAERRRRKEQWAMSPAERLARLHALQVACFAPMSPAGRRHFLARNHHQRRDALTVAGVKYASLAWASGRPRDLEDLRNLPETDA